MFRWRNFTNIIRFVAWYLPQSRDDMTFPTPARNYLLKALAATPDILERLLIGRGSDDPIWDRSPDPIRFTLREMVAHLADWEPIWTERFVRTRDESRPFLPSIDEGQLAAARDYSHQDPIPNLARFRAGRQELVKVLDGLSNTDWDRVCEREFVGPLTLQMMATFVLSHDGYHLQQVVQWLSSN